MNPGTMDVLTLQELAHIAETITAAATLPPTTPHGVTRIENFEEVQADFIIIALFACEKYGEAEWTAAAEAAAKEIEK